jgi:hypothetical protein
MATSITHEALLTEYLRENKCHIYPTFTVGSIDQTGGDITFIEHSGCGYYNDEHFVDVLDLMCWLFSRSAPAVPTDKEQK